MKKGWFVHCEHDLYSGVPYFGPFITEQEARDLAEDQKSLKRFDRIYVLFLSYVEYENEIYALWPETKCSGLIGYSKDEF